MPGILLHFFKLKLIFQNDDCLGCVDAIVVAVNDCNEAGTSTLQCVEDSLGAASECLLCICDVIDTIIGGDGICNNK